MPTFTTGVPPTQFPSISLVNSDGTPFVGNTDVVLPWIVELNPHAFTTQTSWNQKLQLTGLMYSAYNQSSAVQNATIAWNVGISAGTWTIQVTYNKNVNTGIFSIRIDGTEVGTIDTYAASSANNFVDSITGVTVATTGKKQISLVMATKNASSSNYIGIVQRVHLIRTA